MVAALYIVLVLFAAFIGTIAGFGISTILLPILAFWFPFPQALILVGLIHWFGDLWKLILFRSGANWRLILLFGIPGLVVSYLGARLVPDISEVLLRKILGVFLITLSTLVLAKQKWSLPQTSLTAIGGGMVSGLLAGVIGVGGAVRAAFLNVFKLKGAVYLFTNGAIAILTDSSRLFGYYQTGVKLPLGWWVVVASIVASLIGAYAAKQVVDRLSNKRFQETISMLLLLVGLRYLIFG